MQINQTTTITATAPTTAAIDNGAKFAHRSSQSMSEAELSERSASLKKYLASLDKADNS